MRFRLTLTNNGDDEDAIGLSLAVNHSRSGVFLDQFTVTFSDVRKHQLYTHLLLVAYHLIFTYPLPSNFLCFTCQYDFYRMILIPAALRLVMLGNYVLENKWYVCAGLSEVGGGKL